MKDQKKINIIGAGPAGLCAAINLARAGHAVAVYERNSDVGMRFHEDFQGIENWSTSEDLLSSFQKMSIRPDFLCHPYTQGRFLMKGDFGGTVDSPKPLFYLTLRGSSPETLDACLKRQALEAGAILLLNQRRDPKQGDIIATGPRRPSVLATGVIFQTDLPDTVTAYLDNGTAPWGYAYLLVRQGRATLASVYFKNFKNGFDHLERSIKVFQKMLPFSMDKVRRFTGYGHFFPAHTATQNHRLYVGEAAGFQDYLFGFGIRYALTSGYLAARSIIEGVNYDTLWKRSFGKQLVTSLSNRYLFQMFGTLAHRFIILGTTKGNPWRFMNRLYRSAVSRWVASVAAERQFRESRKAGEAFWTEDPNALGRLSRKI